MIRSDVQGGGGLKSRCVTREKTNAMLRPASRKQVIAVRMDWPRSDSDTFLTDGQYKKLTL